jgi:hypothetical protein
LIWPWASNVNNIPSMNYILTGLLLSLGFKAFAETRPAAYVELLDYVQEAPDQGDTNTCLFIASTGAMELLANKFHGIRDPQPYGQFDLAESYVINAPHWGGVSFFEKPVLRFNHGFGVHIGHWPFEAWREGQVNHSVWRRHPNFNHLPRVSLPQIETIRLFQYGNRWSTNIISAREVEQIKQALWDYKSPILVNYNDEGYWHVVLIVGYDDHLPGNCYDTNPKECEGDIGSFYVRDSFGVKVELRDYDWFRVKGNAAFVVKLRD